MFYNHSADYLCSIQVVELYIIPFEVIFCSIFYLSPVNIAQP